MTDKAKQPAETAPLQSESLQPRPESSQPQPETLQPQPEALQPQRLEKQVVAGQDGEMAIELLAQAVPLSRQKLKQLMEKGGIWYKKAKGGRRRLRRAKTPMHKGDILELHYDAHILAIEPPTPMLIADKGAYSVWFKPENMLSQGSKFADHCAITRWVEKNYQPKRTVYLIHRLDRAASGLMLLAHDQKTAAKLSRLFSSRNIQKRYTVSVHGHFDVALPLKIEMPIDGKAAESEVISAMPLEQQSELLVEIKTGRKHQIRRHLSEQGWPVVGDRIYGMKDDEGSLKLTASYLKFICPVSGEPVEYTLKLSS